MMQLKTKQDRNEDLKLFLTELLAVVKSGRHHLVEEVILDALESL